MNATCSLSQSLTRPLIVNLLCSKCSPSVQGHFWYSYPPSPNELGLARMDLDSLVSLLCTWPSVYGLVYLFSTEARASMAQPAWTFTLFYSSSTLGQVCMVRFLCLLLEPQQAWLVCMRLSFIIRYCTMGAPGISALLRHRTTMWSIRLHMWLRSIRPWPVLVLEKPPSKRHLFIFISFSNSVHMHFLYIAQQVLQGLNSTRAQNNNVVDTIAYVAKVDTSLASSCLGKASIQKTPFHIYFVF